MEHDREYFDDLYSADDGDPWGYWESDYEARKYERTLRAVSERRCPETVESVLELGCGNGAMTDEITSSLPEADVVGIDLSKAALATARDRVSGASFRCVEMREFLDRTDDTFDVVFAVECLYYLAPECTVTEWLSFVERLRDALATDGVLVATHVHMRHGDGPVYEQARCTRTIRGLLETAFETVGRDRYRDHKRTKLDPDEPPYQPYQVWTMRPRERERTTAAD